MEVEIGELPAAYWRDMEIWISSTFGAQNRDTWYIYNDWDSIGNSRTTLCLGDEEALLFTLKWL